MTVLLADDSSTLRTLLKRFLVRESDCTVVEAENGLERFSLVLMDIHMPAMDGLEALNLLRDSAHSAVPVVMLTSDRDQALFKTGSRAGHYGLPDQATPTGHDDRATEKNAGLAEHDECATDHEQAA